MNEFYILSEPEGNPEIPKYWSYSQLEEWRNCPRKWWLLRAKYPNINGKYPQVISVPMMEGIILHKTIENFGHYVKDSANGTSSSFKIRNTIHKELKDFFESESSINPRFNERYLKSKFCLDDSINNFKRIINRTENVFEKKVKYKINAAQSPRSILPVKGHEVLITIDSPRIQGRIDLIDNGRIIDFKSGVPDDLFKNQMLFYALLFWLKTGQLPSSLEIMFPKHTSISYNELLKIEILMKFRDDLEEEIKNIEADICLGSLKTNIQIDQCGYCPCRQNCADYWQYLNNLNSNVDTGNGRIKPFWADVEIIELPERWQGFGSCIGIGKSFWGEIYLNIDSDKCPDKSLSKSPKSAKILGALLNYENNHWNLKTKQLTEVFWTL